MTLEVKNPTPFSKKKPETTILKSLGIKGKIIKFIHPSSGSLLNESEKDQLSSSPLKVENNYLVKSSFVVKSVLMEKKIYFFKDGELKGFCVQVK